jgi:hypothetical protein
VLVLSQHLEDRYALELVGDRAEGVGYLLKDRVRDLATVVEAVRRVAAAGRGSIPWLVPAHGGRRRTANRSTG